MAHTNTVYYFLNDDVTAYKVTKSAGRAIEWLTNPSKFVGLSKDYYIKLYDPSVHLILSYGTAIRVLKNIDELMVFSTGRHFGKMVGQYI